MHRHQLQAEEMDSLSAQLQQAKLKEEQQHQRGRPKQPERNYRAYFVGDVLENDPDYQEFLVRNIEERIGASIVGTRLLCRWDPLNKVNFHKYIDDQEQIVVVVRLLNGYALAAWTELPFRPKGSGDGDGLIISLSNRKVFEPVQARSRAIVYDDFYLIFGNSELRLKTQDDKVFSNFGVNRGYYAARGEKVEMLLGSG
jgi:hypothetical protein